MSVVYLALGSNLGDRPSNLRGAIEALEPEVRVLEESSIYETPPWGYTEQPAFLNMAVKAETGLEPRPLLRHLKELEGRLGREPGFRYGPRRIDLDILFYEDLVLQDETLTIPHPRLHERAFVLVPLADIAPDLVHPVRRKTVREMLREVDTGGIEKIET
ncbi:MAG: 2-amino-4-hydroxy-6-hydroxymethyldihydropteridine diphosphokinase [Bacteroidota bacterium]